MQLRVATVSRTNIISRSKEYKTSEETSGEIEESQKSIQPVLVNRLQMWPYDRADLMDVLIMIYGDDYVAPVAH